MWHHPIQKLHPRNSTPEKKSKVRHSTFKGLKILALFAVFFSTGCNGKLYKHLSFSTSHLPNTEDQDKRNTQKLPSHTAFHIYYYSIN